MTGFVASPALLIAAVLALLGFSLIALTWGRRLPRQGDWLVSLGLVVILAACGIGLSLLVDQNYVPETWIRGWISPRDEAGAITVGVLRDPIGVCFAALSALLAVITLVGAGAGAREPRAGRFFASLGISAGGVALAWAAITPWFALTGMAVVFFGGFLALGSRWDEQREAVIATRFGWERSWGLILSLLGLCVLAEGRAPLGLLHAAGGWSLESGQAGGAGPADLLGAGLLFIGAFAQLQPFPLLGWVMSESETYSPARVVTTQVFPAWAVFALLLRLEPQLRAVGVFPDLGWLGLASSLLASVAGVFSTSWRSSLGAWLSAGFALAIAALAFAGPSQAVCVLVGLGLGASALSGFAAALEQGGQASSAHRKRALWAKTGCAIAAAAGTGFIGFVSAGGIARALSLVWAEPALVSVFAAVFFLFAFLGWKVAWQAIGIKDNTQAPWLVVLMPYGLILLALGLVWTGTFSGGAIPGNPDRAFHSWLALFYGPAGEAWGEDASIGAASGLYWAAALVAAGLAFWTTGQKPDFWPGVSRSVPRLSAFVVSGYGVDALVVRFRALLAWSGGVSVRVFDRGVWESWMPGLLGQGARRGAGLIAAGDLWLSRMIGGMMRRWIEWPSRGLQLIQNGDVQWYLFFAVGSGIAILAHFMTKA